MPNKKKNPSPKKPELHPRNKHRGRYDLKLLQQGNPELSQYIIINKYGDQSINFFNAEAVRELNKALLLHYYDLSFWEIPEGYLCPPIPGRADYIHHIADLLSKSNSGKIPEGAKIKCLDIGTGANCVYPIIGNGEYGWNFIGSDIDPLALKSANKIIESNQSLTGKIFCRLQNDPGQYFSGIIEKDELFDISICNPPFHKSEADMKAGTLRKLSNLKKKKITKVNLNFGGKSGELWTEGGEKQFVVNMINQSADYAKSCCWFSTLLSKESNLRIVDQTLKNVKIQASETIPVGQGNKKSRIVAWTFLNRKERNNWAENRWNKEA